MTFADVDFEDGSSSNDLQGNDTNVYQQCDFCGKEMLVCPRAGVFIRSLLQSKRFFCTFCIRHDFHTKKRKNVLILSFRGIIAYLYYNCYMINPPNLYLSQIEDMVVNHANVGLLNPAFYYDSETFCWFVDFNKIGNQLGKKCLPLDQIINTVNDIISVFNLYDNAKSFKGHKLSQKFEEAIIDFHSRRYRPAEKRLLSPTMSGCVIDVVTTNNNNVPKKNIEHRDFLPQHLKIHPRR